MTQCTPAQKQKQESTITIISILQKPSGGIHMYIVPNFSEVTITLSYRQQHYVQTQEVQVSMSSILKETT
jgi:hypothetical protein